MDWGILPLFPTGIPGLSILEMTAPGVFFGGDGDSDGCWEWKGPVIQEKFAAYGKFFRRKAGFVTLDLLGDFINYRRTAYPIAPDSTEESLLEIISMYGSISSTELRRVVFGTPRVKRRRGDPVDITRTADVPAPAKRHSLESPLQRLQMSGRIIISDFTYKQTSKGRKYGWGVAVYSTPEEWFGRRFGDTERTPEESLRRLVEHLHTKLPYIPAAKLEKLLR